MSTILRSQDEVYKYASLALAAAPLYYCSITLISSYNTHCKLSLLKKLKQDEDITANIDTITSTEAVYLLDEKATSENLAEKVFLNNQRNVLFLIIKNPQSWTIQNRRTMIRFLESHECILENENDAKCDKKEIFDCETSIKCLTISYKTSSLSPSSIFTTLLPKLKKKLPYNNFYYLNNPLKQLNLQNSLLPNFKIEEDPFSKSLLDKHGSYIDEADLSSYFFKIKTPNETSVEDVIKKCSAGCEVSWWHEGYIYTGRAFGHKGEGGCVILGDSNALRIAKKVGIRCVVPDDINWESVLGLVRWLSFGEVDQGLEFEKGGGWRVVKDDIVEEEEVEKNDKKDGDKKDGEKKTEKENKWKPKYKLGDEVIYGEENTLSTITAVIHSSKTYTLSSKTTIIISMTSKSKNIIDNISEKDLSRFTPKPVHLIVNSQVTSKFALNFTQKHGHKNNSSNHTLSDDRYISSLIFVSQLLPSLILLDSLPTPIQIHDGTSAQKKYLSRKSKEFTKFGQRLKNQPRFTFFMPKVDFETGRFLLKYQVRK